MTKQEAIQAMREGKRVRHRYFTTEEWVKSNPQGTIYTLEDGVEITYREFWWYRQNEAFDEGWELFTETPKK